MTTSSTLLQILPLSKHATIPRRGSNKAAGLDLASAYDYIVPPFSQALVKTDLACKLPRGTYGRIAPRSGLALKKFISIGGGVIDSDFRGNIGIIIFNHSDKEFIIKKGMFVAQLILTFYCNADVQIVESLDETDRGTKGFGSTTMVEMDID